MAQLFDKAYTFSQIHDLFVIFGECNKVNARTCREFNAKYPSLPPITEKKLKRIQNNYVLHGTSVCPIQRRKQVTGDEDTQIMVLAYFFAFPRRSIRTAVIHLGVSYSSVQRILSMHFMHNFKAKTVHQLLPRDFMQRIELTEMLLVNIQEDEDFLKKLIWSDESKFSRDGIFNRRNNHYWSTSNPNFVVERHQQQKFSFNVFCLLMDNKCVYHVYNENLNEVKYLDILQTVVTDFIDNLPLNLACRVWYQLDGAPAHCTELISNQLNVMFEDRWIRRRGPWNWPPRSPDLNPLDFFLWGHIKNSVYDGTSINTPEELLNRVHLAFASLQPEQIRNSTTSHVKHNILKCIRLNGGHIEL